MVNKKQATLEDVAATTSVATMGVERDSRELVDALNDARMLIQNPYKGVPTEAEREEFQGIVEDLVHGFEELQFTPEYILAAASQLARIAYGAPTVHATLALVTSPRGTQREGEVYMARITVVGDNGAVAWTQEHIGVSAVTACRILLEEVRSTVSELATFSRKKANIIDEMLLSNKALVQVSGPRSTTRKG